MPFPDYDCSPPGRQFPSRPRQRSESLGRWVCGGAIFWTAFVAIGLAPVTHLGGLGQGLRRDKGEKIFQS